MTSQAAQQIIAIHILPNISSSKDNQIIKFVQSKYREKFFLFKDHAENKELLKKKHEKEKTS